MKKKSHKLRRLFIVASIIVIVVVGIIIAFVSPIAKYVIEKYSVKYTGRQIKMSWIYVNPFTGFIHASKLKVYEPNKDSVFISVGGLSAKIDLFKILSKTYEVTEVTLTKPWIKIVQNKDTFNFNDIIEHFRPKESGNVGKEPVHFNILNIKINSGEFHYVDQQISVNYFIKNVNIESSGKWWNIDTMRYKFAFQSGLGAGDINGNLLVNMKNADYNLGILVNHFDLKVFEQYMQDFANYGSFRASMDANINATGNFGHAQKLDANGQLAINDLHVGKAADTDYASFKKLNVNIIELSPYKNKYSFDSVSITNPFLLYERYDYLDNIERMFGKQGSNISSVTADSTRTNVLVEIAHYIKALATNFFQSDFKVNKLAIYNGNFKFSDYSLSEKFSMEVDPIYIAADSIYNNKKRVNLSFKSGIKPYGKASVNLSMDPKAYGDFDMVYSVNDISVPLFNPYTITYTSFPLNRGTIDFNGNWNVRNGNIQSNNHLLIIDPYTTKRIKNCDTKWIPVPLILSFIRERGNVIDYEIPIKGNLKNPQYDLKYVVFDLLNNIFVKPPTIPYGVHVSTVEDQIDNSIMLTWGMRQSELQPAQKKFVKKIADFLKKNPNAFISIYRISYSEKEKEHILFYEAKKKYFMIKNNKKSFSFTADDSIKVDRMSNKDTEFVHYLNRHASNGLMFTVQEKCDSFVGKGTIKRKFNELLKDRENQFMAYFKEQNVENRVKIHTNEAGIPYDGFSYYEINYNGNIPDELRAAYNEMNEVNDDWFRKKYKRNRKEIQGIYERQAGYIKSSKKENRIL